jgi:hypothetical protein
MQQAIVILIVGACMVWLGFFSYRYFRPKAGKGCAGGCCGGSEEPAKDDTAAAPRIQMISSDEMRARLKARRS